VGGPAKAAPPTSNVARIRVQLSAAHTPEHVTRAVNAFEKVGRARGVLT
jgi:7-keto-8-aminopelargonate synthetase-like enzyme